jgi:LysM repeat protein
MNLKLFTALLCAGIALLIGTTAFVATLPASSSAQSHKASVHALPNGWTVSHTGGTTSTSTTSRTPPTSSPQPATPRTTEPATSPPSTAFVLVTITYQVKKGDTVSSIAKWFGQHGFATQFAANLQVIDDNQDLLVPGALISLSNGVMTIHSPI